MTTKEHISVCIRVRPPQLTKDIISKKLENSSPVSLIKPPSSFNRSKDLLEPSNSKSNLATSSSGCNIAPKHQSGQAGQIGTPKGNFAFEAVYPAGSTTKEIYLQQVRPVVLDVLNGYNGCIMAYGQTNSGKTYTISGIMELMINDLYAITNSDQTKKFLIGVSFLEVYNEHIKDLIQGDSSKTIGLSTSLNKSPEKEIEVSRENYEKIVISDTAQFQHINATAIANRKTGATNFNEHSSRSHLICILNIKSTILSLSGNSEASDKNNLRQPEAEIAVSKPTGSCLETTVSKPTGSCLETTVSKPTGPELLQCTESNIYIVDLAGSEAIGKGGITGDRKAEGLFINKSLLTLGNIIMKLSNPAERSGHIPYRDSKLTRLLQSSLDGDSRVVMICTVSFEPENLSQTISTLQFASKAKTIELNAKKHTYGGSCTDISNDLENILQKYSQRAEKNFKDQIDRINAENVEMLNSYIGQLRELEREQNMYKSNYDELHKSVKENGIVINSHFERINEIEKKIGILNKDIQALNDVLKEYNDIIDNQVVRVNKLNDTLEQTSISQQKQLEQLIADKVGLQNELNNCLTELAKQSQGLRQAVSDISKNCDDSATTVAQKYDELKLSEEDITQSIKGAVMAIKLLNDKIDALEKAHVDFIGSHESTKTDITCLNTTFSDRIQLTMQLLNKNLEHKIGSINTNLENQIFINNKNLGSISDKLEHLDTESKERFSQLEGKPNLETTNLISELREFVKQGQDKLHEYIQRSEDKLVEVYENKLETKINESLGKCNGVVSDRINLAMQIVNKNLNHQIDSKLEQLNTILGSAIYENLEMSQKLEGVLSERINTTMQIINKNVGHQIATIYNKLEESVLANKSLDLLAPNLETFKTELQDLKSKLDEFAKQSESKLGELKLDVSTEITKKVGETIVQLDLEKIVKKILSAYNLEKIVKDLLAQEEDTRTQLVEKILEKINLQRDVADSAFSGVNSSQITTVLSPRSASVPNNGTVLDDKISILDLDKYVLNIIVKYNKTKLDKLQKMKTLFTTTKDKINYDLFETVLLNK